MLMCWMFGSVPKGSKITFTTETFGLAFYVGQRKVRFFSRNLLFSFVSHDTLIVQFTNK